MEDDAGDDLTQDEVFEEKLRETIDLATQKSANGKQSFLQNCLRDKCLSSCVPRIPN